MEDAPTDTLYEFTSTAPMTKEEFEQFMIKNIRPLLGDDDTMFYNGSGTPPMGGVISSKNIEELLTKNGCRMLEGPVTKALRRALLELRQKETKK